jgi:hypothetical protein
MLALLLPALQPSAWAGDPSQFHAGAAGCRIINPKPGGADRATWSGPCKRDYADGEGLLVWFAGDQESSRYQGTLKRGLPDGDGSIAYASGDSYRGGFQAGLPHGPGTWRFATGGTLQASFAQGLPTGDVERRYPSGDTYVGDWRDGHPHGAGTMQYALGGSYAGNWRLGRRDGPGTLSYPDGRQLQRSFSDDVPFQPAAIDAVLSALPANRSFDKLTPEQQASLRNAYPVLQPGDEPPYPQYGRLPLLLKFQDAQRRIWPSAELSLDVLVDRDGVPHDVRVLASPAPELAELGTQVLLATRFKPARCSAQPCAMRYPLHVRLPIAP